MCVRPLIGESLKACACPLDAFRKTTGAGPDASGALEAIARQMGGRVCSEAKTAPADR